MIYLIFGAILMLALIFLYFVDFRSEIKNERRRNAESFATFLRLLDGLDDIRIREVLKREIEIYERKIKE